MLLICLNVAVNGSQIRRLCIFLSKWNSEKVYVRFLTNERFEIVGSVLKRREVFIKCLHFKENIEINFQRHSLFL